MAHFGKTALLTTLIIPGAALAQINAGDMLGSSETAIQATLEAQGYTITEIETENGEIEVEAKSGGQFFEFEVSPETGLVLAANQEGEDDEDANDDDKDDPEDDADDDDENDD